MKSKKIIAYLILAHNQENHFYDLIKKLNNKEVCFFVHIDRKSNQELFEEKMKDLDNISFVKERENVIWKGFSPVQATLKMIELALNSKYSFKYFILLSGVDYPIKPNKSVLDFFKNTDKNYIEFSEIKSSNNYLSYFKNEQRWFKISKWHFYDTFKINWNSRTGSLKHQIYRVYILFNILFLNIFLPRKSFPKSINKYYFGSSWWCLNRSSIDYIYNFLRSNRASDLIKLYKYSDSSDEMFFQTVLLNSKYEKECVNNNLRFIDWNKKREGPAILDGRDFEKIKRSNCLFARKFDFEKSKNLKEKINNGILK